MSERPESQFPADFSRVTEPILRAAQMGVMTVTELRENLRKAGLVLGDDQVLDPDLPELPPFDEDDGEYHYDGAVDDEPAPAKEAA